MSSLFLSYYADLILCNIFFDRYVTIVHKNQVTTVYGAYYDANKNMAPKPSVNKLYISFFIVSHNKKSIGFEIANNNTLKWLSSIDRPVDYASHENGVQSSDYARDSNELSLDYAK